MSYLAELHKTVSQRRHADPSESWTAKLISDGRKTCAKKFGEEAIEAIIACMSDNRSDLIRESADVVYHLIVLLAASDIDWAEVERELQKRSSMSGIEEKRMRKTGAD